MSSNKTNIDTLSPVKHALLEIRQLRRRLEESEGQKHEPIAIIGMGCRIPGRVNNPESFWRLLRNAEDAIIEIPPDRWDVDAFFDSDPDAPGKMSTRWGGFLEDIDRFDPDFFGISPRETVTMDPQQRLLLEVAWESLENAGIAPTSLYQSATGVFVGIAGFDYGYLHLCNVDPKLIDAYFATGGTHSVASGRLSYALGLQGPSISVDTACSSSLVAVHQACQSLRWHECDMALAGGVNIILIPEFHINFSKAHVLASDGRCKTFDTAADGFVRSEGCGIVVLKRLSDALEAGDVIHAVVRGTALNQDGRSSGLTVPNGPSQQAVIKRALVDAGVKPSQVQYIEAHGTGTSLGDPIEVQSLAAVFGKERSKEDPLLIGSVKTNVGHLETAAGVIGLMKLVLALKHKIIPPHLHLKQLNPHVPWKDIPVEVPTDGVPWPSGDARRVGGVSAFGFSGTNAHIVVEEAPAMVPRANEAERPAHILTISAKTEAALKIQAHQYVKYLSDYPDINLADVCYTAGAGRSHFDKRVSIITDSVSDARDQLARVKENVEINRGPSAKEAPELVFLFTGQGAQYVNMGRQLYETQATFRQALGHCSELLEPYLKEPLLSILYPDNGNQTLLDKTVYIQPALFAFEYAMTELWRSWGIKPAAVIGHSLGEYTAACVAGVFSLQDALHLIVERTRLMQSLPDDGMMAAVFAPEDRVRSAVAPHSAMVAISGVNSPENTVISGETKTVKHILSQLEKEGIHAHPLQVSRAFHSPLMDPILNPFKKFADQIQMHAPNIPISSNLTGQLISTDHTIDSEYWKRHLRETVKFTSGIQALYNHGFRVYIEMGPHPILCSLGRECIPNGDAVWLPSLRRKRNDWKEILNSLGELYSQGATADWKGFDRDYHRKIVTLPTYPFQREKYWLEISEHPSRHIRSAKKPAAIWEDVISKGRRQALQIPVDLELQAYESKWQIMDRLAISYIQKTFYDKGLFHQSGEAQTLDSLMRKMQVQSSYKNLVYCWLSHLCNLGILMRKKENFICRKPLLEPDLTKHLFEAREVLSDIPYLLSYIERCGVALLRVLAGEKSPIETIFPEGSLETAVQIHHHWAVSRYFNKIAGAIIDTIVHHSAHEEPLRILELGAGVGGLTSNVLSLLPADRTEYWYTDISEFFLVNAQTRFKDYPFVRYGRLDIESPPSQQGYGTHGFDIVIADNILHGIRSLDKALDHILSLLSPGGFLILRETTRHFLWFDMTFGLLETARDPNDPIRRENERLTVEQWEKAIHSKEFKKVAFFPKPGSPAASLSQHVIVAQLPMEMAIVERILPDDPEVSVKDSDYILNLKESKPERVDSGQSSFLKRLLETPEINRHDQLIALLRKTVMQILRRDESKPVERNRRLMDLGIDSLMAVELRTLLKEELELETDLTATLIYDYPTIEDITVYLNEQILNYNDSSIELNVIKNTSVKNEESPSPSGAKIENLTEEEMEQLLVEKLDKLEEEN